MRRPSKIIRCSSTCWGFLVVLVIAVVTIVKNSLTLQGGGSSSSSPEKTNKSVTTTTTTTTTSTEKEKNPPPVDGSEPSFLLPSTNDFRPVTSLSRTCTPDPTHNQPMQSIQTFSEYSNSSVFFDTTTTTFRSNDDNDDDDLLTICEFIPKDNAMHFAHSMQQLYGCYSYWQTTNNIHQEHRRRRRPRPVLIMPSYKVKTKLEANPFLKGYLRLLQDSSFGLEIITKNQYKEKYINNRNSTTNHEKHHTQTIDVSGGYVLSHAKELNNLLLEDGRKDNPLSNYLFSSQATIRQEQQQQQQPDCVTSSTQSTPRIGILNRRKSVGRSIINVQKLVDTLSEFTNNTIPVEYFEEKTFDKQIEFFANVDILISPHGAQLTGLPFMLLQQQHQKAFSCSYLLEIFPKQYALPNFYGSLATNSGINYSYLYLSNKSYQDERQSETVAERIHARAQDLCPSPDLMLTSIQLLIRQWEECMSCNGNNN